jgi:glycosyltransferase involved in cell wall biosynthesis
VSGKYKGIIVYSDIAAESFQRSNLEINKIHKVPLIAPKVSQVEFSILSRKPRSLLYVGRGHIEKGLDIAIGVANALKVEITVIGNFNPEIVSWIRQQNGVNFKGRMSRIEVLNAMHQHEVYLGTSIESFGYSTVEAIQSGMKIVGTPYIGALNWYPTAPNLFISETLDVETISSAVSQAFESDFEPSEDFSEIDPYSFWLKVANDSV